MAYTYSQLASDVIAAWEADKPVMLGENILGQFKVASDAYPLPANWKAFQTRGGNFADYPSDVWTNATDTTYPIRRAWDRFTHKPTRAQLPALTPLGNDRWALVTHTSSLDIRAFDSFALLGHNFGTLSKAFGTYSGSGTPFEIYVGISNDGINWTEIANFTDPLTDRPIVDFNFTGAGAPTTYRAYDKVDYVQVSIVCPGATMGLTSSTLPQIGELMLGSRCQLLHGPTVPYFDRNIGADVEYATPTTGQGIPFVRSIGRRKIQATYPVTTDRSNVLTFYQKHLQQGLNPFLYVPKKSKAEYVPYTFSFAGESFWMTLQEETFGLPLNDAPFDSTLVLNMLEAATYNVDWA